MSYCKKCYVDSKKAGIIEENGIYFMGSLDTDTCWMIPI